MSNFLIIITHFFAQNWEKQHFPKTPDFIVCITNSKHRVINLKKLMNKKLQKILKRGELSIDHWILDLQTGLKTIYLR